MLVVCAIVERFASLRVEFLVGPAPDEAIELDVWRIELCLARLQVAVNSLYQSCYFVAIEKAIVVIKIVQVSGVVVFRLVVASFDTPNISPVRGRRMIGTEQIVGTRNLLVKILLDQPARNDASFDNAA